MTDFFKEALARCRSLYCSGDLDAAYGELRTLLRADKSSPELVQKAGRMVSKWEFGSDPQPVHLRLFGECTLTWLKYALAATAVRDGMRVSVSEAAYDNIIQEIASLSESEIPDLAVLVPWNSRLLSQQDGNGSELEDLVAFWEQAWSMLAEAGCGRVLQVGYDWMRPGASGYCLSSQSGDIALIRALNDRLRAAMPAGVALFDIDTVASVEGKASFYDPRRYHWTKQPYSETGVVRLAEHLSAAVRAALNGPKKSLVLDLDNTLWGGVVGEVGAAGVAVSDSPEGEAYATFQRVAKSLSERGVLLAVASKNNLEDAREPFDTRSEMPLEFDDFVAFEANWEPKYQSLVKIAAQLNLGLDSFVFFDDNPVEREEMRIHLPQVSVIDVPSDPALYVDALQESLLFETGKVTDTDLKRVSIYKEEAKRRDFQRSAGSVHDYLRSLKMVASVETIGEANMARVEQLLLRTNQFNLTTRRLGQSEIESALSEPGSIGLALSLRDRFGDHGLVSSIIGVPTDSGIHVLAWVMSCRVMGRGVESFFFEQFVGRALTSGFAEIVGEYIPSKKNAPAEHLYPALGFDLVAENGGGKLYRAAPTDVVFPAHFIDLAAVTP